MDVVEKFDTDVADKEGLAETEKDIAMQITAANPACLAEVDAPEEVLVGRYWIKHRGAKINRAKLTS